MHMRKGVYTWIDSGSNGMVYSLSTNFVKTMHVIAYHVTSVYIIFDERPNSPFFAGIIVKFVLSRIC